MHRTTGDMLIVYDFQGGTTDAPTLTLRRWYETEDDTIPPDNDPFPGCEVSSNDPPCWGVASPLGAGVAEAKVNTGSTPASTAPTDDDLAPPPAPATESVTDPLGTNEFGEAGIDLTAAGVIDPDVCESFGTVFGVSRSSGNSATAQMKDLVGPGPFAIQTCAPTATTTRQRWLPNDSAQVLLEGGAPASGTVTFKLYNNGTCDPGEGEDPPEPNVLATFGPITLNSNGVASTNNQTHVVTSATISWKATFTPTAGSSVLGSTGPCETSTLTIDNDGP